MKRIFGLTAILLLVSLSLRAGQISVYDLRCSGLTNPVGIGNDPYFGWKIHSESRDFRQTAYRIQISADKMFTGPLLWDSGKVSSSNSICVQTPFTPPEPMKHYYWRVKIWGSGSDESTWSQPAGFVSGLPDDRDWHSAQWIAMDHDLTTVIPAIHAPEVPKDSTIIPDYRLPIFRRTFSADSDLSHATLFICGLGQFDALLNGKKIGRHFLDPGWTRYNREAEYVGFDITDMIRNGQNTIGIMLGNGMYHIPQERYYKFVGSFGAPKFRAILRLVYADGRTDDIVSDTTWKCTPGPVTFSSIFGGEDYDARLNPAGWTDGSGFDDSQWRQAVTSECNTALKPQLGTALEVREIFSPNTVTTLPSGRRLYDFGQNMSGIPRLTVKGRPGQKIVMYPGELIDSDSCVSQTASGKPFFYTYTIGSDSTEIWQPQFTYYGFRYLEVEADTLGLPAPEIVDLQALHTSSENEITGSFHCSDQLFNRIYQLIDKAMSSNTASVLTDCPHREKLGWLEQAHLMQNSLSYRRDMRHIYAKLMSDMAASQLENGAIPTIAPEYVRFEGGFEDSPEWGSAFIQCPYNAWLWYGDSELLSRYYPAMKKFMEYLGSRAYGHIVAYGLGDWYDIGPGEPGYSQLTTSGLTATAIYYQNAIVMSEIARILGHDGDCADFRRLAADIRSAFNSRFLNTDGGYYDRNSQTANAMPLALGMTDEDMRPKVAASLADNIISGNYALTAGDIGYRYLLKALENTGRSDIIYRMNSNFTGPGYGWQLAHGATSLTESWQAYGFVSNNHMMLGHLMEWLFGSIGGIRPDPALGSGNLIFNPQPIGNIDSAETSVVTPYGEAECKWRLKNGRMTIHVSVPPNSSAKIILPQWNGTTVTDYGQPLTLTDGNIINVGSGRYLLEYESDRRP